MWFQRDWRMKHVDTLSARLVSDRRGRPRDHCTVTMWASALIEGSVIRSAEHTLHAPAVRAAWRDGYWSPVTNVGWLHRKKQTKNPQKDVVFTEFMRRWGVLLFFAVVFRRRISRVLLYESKSITLAFRQRTEQAAETPSEPRTVWKCVVTNTCYASVL